MIQYRFYLGRDLDLKATAGVLAEFGIDGATLLPGTGIWKGQLEPCTVVEVFVGEDLPASQIADRFATVFEQEAVLFTRLQVPTTLRFAGGDSVHN